MSNSEASDLTDEAPDSEEGSPVSPEDSEGLPTPAEAAVRWVGGKRNLVKDHSKFLLPASEIKEYHEPFGGGLAVYRRWAYGCEKAYINDILPEMGILYTALQKEVETVIEELMQMINDHDLALAMGVDSAREVFKLIRAQFNEWRGTMLGSHVSNAKVAAMVLFLNRCSVNGLHRISKKGKCNTPYRTDLKPGRELCRAKNLRSMAKLLQRTDATITAVDFATATRPMTKGAYTFFDPPYLPRKEGKDGTSFTAYTDLGFDKKAHSRLVAEMDRIDSLGAKFTLTASDTPESRLMYAKWNTRAIEVNHSVSARSKGRGMVGELVIDNWS